MINAIISASLRDRFMVLIATVIIALVGFFAYKNAPLDAIPDLSDVQVIIFTEYPGQSPQVVEDQVTYPLTTSMLAVPRTKVVRGYSFFGLSFVYIIFEDGTDMYWARSRVLESINYVSGRLPQGITPTLGPDATGVGWVYEYALVDKTGKHDLAQLRSLQDWYLRYPLQTVQGVSEVASVGGYVKQYQVEVDPNALQRYNISLNKIKMAIKMSNKDVGGRLVEMAETEYMVRGLGYIQSIDDLNSIPVSVDSDGTPIRLQDIAHVILDIFSQICMPLNPGRIYQTVQAFPYVFWDSPAFKNVFRDENRPNRSLLAIFVASGDICCCQPTENGCRKLVTTGENIGCVV